MSYGQQRSYVEPIPLHDSHVHQATVELSLGRVPALPDDARINGATARTIRYDRGRERWYVSASDKARVRAYYRFRDADEVAAGANPVSAQYHDGSPIP